MSKTKLPKGIDSTFVDSIQALSREELKARIVQIQMEVEENEAFKETEAYIQAKTAYDLAREDWKLVAGPIKDTAVTLKNKTKLLIERLKERGGN